MCFSIQNSDISRRASRAGVMEYPEKLSGALRAPGYAETQGFTRCFVVNDLQSFPTRFARRDMQKHKVLLSVFGIKCPAKFSLQRFPIDLRISWDCRLRPRACLRNSGISKDFLFRPSACLRDSRISRDFRLRPSDCLRF